MSYQDLGEHAGALVTLLGVFAGVSGFLFWRMLSRLERKVEELHQLCCDCRQELGERFMNRFDHEMDHQELWTAINSHDHDFRGRVVR